MSKLGPVWNYVQAILKLFCQIRENIASILLYDLENGENYREFLFFTQNKQAKAEGIRKERRERMFVPPEEEKQTKTEHKKGILHFLANKALNWLKEGGTLYCGVAPPSIHYTVTKLVRWRTALFC